MKVGDIILGITGIIFSIIEIITWVLIKITMFSYPLLTIAFAIIFGSLVISVTMIMIVLLNNYKEVKP